MTPMYLTFFHDGTLVQVVDLTDIHGRPTSDPGLAKACTIRFPDGRTVQAPAEDVPIYTVH